MYKSKFWHIIKKYNCSQDDTKSVVWAVLYFDIRLYSGKNKRHYILQYSAKILVAAAGFEPTTFGLWVLNIRKCDLHLPFIIADI